jgi:DNA repair exonuclease SbcCD nuclease subunit
MRALVCADIHLGRIPATPQSSILSSRFAWDAVVETAIKEKVDAIALAGDVIDQDEAWFEAYGPLLKQVKKLEDNGISIVSVAGNHDHKVFPRLVEEGTAIHILGLSGTWEVLDLKGARFVGWSFPNSTYSQDPFDSFDKELLETPLPTLGLLHCNVNGIVGKDRYAPIPSNKFSTYSHAFWVLGHIHKSSYNDEYLYCGSPMALDSSECGLHGVWILESEGTAWAEPQFIQLCPYRFENCEIKLDTAATPENLTTYIHKELKRYAEKLTEEQYAGALYPKLTFTGTVSPSFDLKSILMRDQLEAWEFPEIGGVEISPLPDYEDLTTPDLDLVELAKGIGPKALLAKRLLDIESADALLSDIESMKEESINSKTFSLVQEIDGFENDSDTISLIRRAGMRLLRSMLAQGDRDE